VTSERCLDAVALKFGRSVDDGEIGFFDGTAAELLCDFPLCGVVFCNDEKAGGVFVEPVYDSGSELAEPRGEPAAVVDEGIDESAVGVASSGVNDDIGRFVQDNKVVVFIDDVEGDIFGENFL